MIILTGAAGFIGSHLVDAFSPKQRLLLVDHPQHFRDRNYVPGVEASLWDWATGQEGISRYKLIDRAYFPKVLEAIGPVSLDKKSKENILIPNEDRIEAVVHMGACTDTAETRKDFLDQWNFSYTKSIWNWCSKHGVPLVYASSGATYGAGEFGFSDSWETALRLKPLNAYGQSKQDFDLWAMEESKKGITPPFWYGLKFFNVYGPRESHKGPMASAILHSYRHIRTHGSCRLFKSHHPDVKDGEQKRDFIHVSDIVKLVEFVLEKKPTPGLYNCGTGQARTFHSMMESLFESMEKPMKIDWIDTPPQYRKAYQYFTEARMEKMLEAGFKNSFLPLEEGVKQYVNWLEKNEPKMDFIQ